MPQVKPRPLHRSLTFWSGIFVLLAVSSWWRDSIHHQTFISGSRYTLLSDCGMVSLWRSVDPELFQIERRKNLYGDPDGFTLSHGLEASIATFPPPLWIQNTTGPQEYDLVTGEFYHQRCIKDVLHSPRGTWMLAIPHWLLLLAVALPWSLLLLWRARRVRAALPGR